MRLLLTCILLICTVFGFSQTQTIQYIIEKEDFCCSGEVYYSRIVRCYKLIDNTPVKYYNYKTYSHQKLNPVVIKKDTLWVSDDSLYIVMDSVNFNNNPIDTAVSKHIIQLADKKIIVGNKEFDTKVFVPHITSRTHDAHVDKYDTLYIDKLTNISVKHYTEFFKFWRQPWDSLIFIQQYYKTSDTFPVINNPENLVIYKSPLKWTTAQRNTIKYTLAKDANGEKICKCILKWADGYISFYDFVYAPSIATRNIIINCWDKYDKK